MKKINKIILLLIAVLPLTVKADMAAPMERYKVRVSNPEGAAIYEYDSNTQKWFETDKKVDYDKVCDVQYENDEYLLVSCPEYESFRLLSKDVSPLEVTLEDYKGYETKQYYVYDENVYLYKGPSKIYGKVEPEKALAVGTIIESNYYDEQWIYINYDGTSGWVYSYMYSKYNDSDMKCGLAYISSEKIKTIKETPMYKSPISDEKLGTIIPKNVELKTLYNYNNFPESNIFYVEYNGTKGWIKTESQPWDVERINKHEESITNIAYYSKYKITVTNPNGVDMYEDIDDANSKVATIPYGEVLESNYYLEARHEDGWHEVEYNGKVGFITNTYHQDGTTDLSMEAEETDTGEEVIDDEKTTEDIVIELTNGWLQKILSMKMLLIYIVSGVVLLSATAVVTIILVNKKKKNKNAK